MLDLSSEFFYGCGGIGDLLMIINKMKNNHIDNKKLVFFCPNEKYAKSSNELAILNNINIETRIQGNINDPNYDILKIKEKRNIITTCWNGDISNDEIMLKTFDSDMISISDNLIICGKIPDLIIDEPYMMLQLDAGFMYHSSKKHWKNIDFVLRFFEKICKKFLLKCVIFGLELNEILPNYTLQNNFINCPNTGFRFIEYLKKSKFSVCLSGIGALSSLMLEVPTIWKREGDKIFSNYYAHPKWKNRMFEIQEIIDDKDEIIKFIERHI